MAGTGSGNASTSFRNDSQRPELKSPQGSMGFAQFAPHSPPADRFAPPAPCRPRRRWPTPRPPACSVASHHPSGPANPVRWLRPVDEPGPGRRRPGPGRHFLHSQGDQRRPGLVQCDGVHRVNADGAGHIRSKALPGSWPPRGRLRP